jgi:hypothetical protein
MREILTEITIKERLKQGIIETIKEAGYIVEMSKLVWNQYCIKKERGFFKPKLRVMIRASEIILVLVSYCDNQKEFIREFEESTCLELVKYV